MPGLLSSHVRRRQRHGTGAPPVSGVNNWEVTKAYIDGDRAVHRNFDRIGAIAIAMRESVQKGAWSEVGRLLREEWSNRRKNAPGITNPLIDELVRVTRKAGALGAKVCGAGGGGCGIPWTLAGFDPVFHVLAKVFVQSHSGAASLGGSDGFRDQPAYRAGNRITATGRWSCSTTTSTPKCSCFKTAANS